MYFALAGGGRGFSCLPGDNGLEGTDGKGFRQNGKKVGVHS
jgi:hypothetical protein